MNIQHATIIDKAKGLESPLWQRVAKDLSKPSRGRRIVNVSAGMAMAPAGCTGAIVRAGVCMASRRRACSAGVNLPSTLNVLTAH